MEPRIARLNKIAPRRIRVQAALWVTELHGPDRNAELEERVRRWIAEDPRQAAAFELATEAWQRSGNLPAYLPKRARPKASRKALAGMAILCAAMISAAYFLRDPTLVTGPGEQRTVELSDGTQVSLNANSRIIVQYDDRVRKLILASGEVLFNVIKHQPRPFVVVIGNQKVIAMGTSFLVRREESSESAFAVTLVEGRVAIEPLSWPDVLPSASVTGLTLLNPGERLRFSDGATEKRDSPSIDRVTAWRRGQLIFDDTSLSEAAAEFNRYGSHKITIDGPV
ncbi:MAG: transrane sensor, partial [Acidobacteriaceae bacterium]|nr:transrane sensor [Acidobacteriaceae bacterium]